MPVLTLRGILRAQGLLALLAWAWFTGAASAQPSSAREHEVKAGFLTVFPQYTIWPTNTFASSNAPVIIGVLGDDPFGPTLDETARAQHGQRTIEIRRVSTVEEAARCHIVFIARSETRSEASWLAALKDKPVLTVGESGQTIERGGMVEFVIVAKRARYDISWPAVGQSGLRLSTEMLAHARKVHQPPKTE